MPPSDAFSSRRALAATGLLGAFNDAGVIAAADVHVARRLCAVLGEADESVLLAMAMAVRGPRLGHVHVDLATIRDTATVEPYGDEDEPLDLAALPWPDADWADRVAVSPMVSDGPLRLEGSRLYLDRYWREERQVADDLLSLDAPLVVGDEARLADGITRLFDDPSQARAGEVALRRRLAIVAGGPGTGKTTTVARILALLFENDPTHPPLVALAAPTGKAQARLQEAIATEADELDVTPAIRERILDLRASTLHRLLGWRPDSRSRFRHNRGQRLPHDVVIVDETSMVSLSQMARLLEAIRPEARLILVGDPGQLASVEAGAVLGDIVRARGGPLADAVVELQTVHRHGGAIAELGRRIAAGDAAGALALLTAGAEDLEWRDEAGVLEPALAAAAAVRAAAEAGDGPGALEALTGFRVLCAHRREAAAWGQRIEDSLGVDPRAGRFPPGRPLLITRNDYDVGLYNGDTGVVVADGERAVAHFERGISLSPARLNAVEDAYAMTVHKAQGSQFGTAAVVLPAVESRILTRELLYTACTRAQDKLILAGSEDAIRLAIERPIARASGLSARLG